MKKKVSVITVNYNNLKGLERTISSVLSQSFSDFEYIIVDGGSTDGSKEYIESKQEYINQWVSEKDHGVYNAMNKAIRMAQGEYCIFMNSGDHFFSSQSAFHHRTCRSDLSEIKFCSINLHLPGLSC